MRIAVWVLMLGMTVCAAASAAGAAANAMTREQALHALSAEDSAQRRAAVLVLRDAGTMSDVQPLLAALRDRDIGLRGMAEDAVWTIWSRSGDRAVDLLYRQGMRQMQMGALGDAITTFTRIIRKKPDFAEAWNKRATLYYTAGEFDKSLHDCAETLKRNPSHFGALTGYGLIYMSLDEPERALDYFARALAINPNMPDIEGHMRQLRRLIDEKRKRYV